MNQSVGGGGEGEGGWLACCSQMGTPKGAFIAVMMCVSCDRGRVRLPTLGPSAQLRAGHSALSLCTRDKRRARDAHIIDMHHIHHLIGHNRTQR